MVDCLKISAVPGVQPVGEPEYFSTYRSRRQRNRVDVIEDDPLLRLTCIGSIQIRPQRGGCDLPYFLTHGTGSSTWRVPQFLQLRSQCASADPRMLWVDVVHRVIT